VRTALDLEELGGPRPFEVHGQDALELLRRVLVEGREQAGAGVVHNDIEAAETLVNAAVDCFCAPCCSSRVHKWSVAS
jgi:hypothetical protein